VAIMTVQAPGNTQACSVGSTAGFSPVRTAPYRLSAFPFEPATMLAPMEGVTNPLYRDLIAGHGGIGVLCTEFVRVTVNSMSLKAVRRQVVKTPGVPLLVQVMGNELERMMEAAAMMSRLGADVVDINLGCPAPKAVRKGVGSEMLKKPELTYDVIRAMREVVPGLLSAKMRAGAEDSSRVGELAQIVEAAGVDFLTVHPRRRVDYYTGVADWRVIRRLRELLRVPVVGNGDIWYASDAVRMVEQTGCHAVMMGRGAMRNPWIFRQLADVRAGRPPMEPTGRDVVGWIVALADGYRAAAAPGRAPVGPLKEQVSWLGRAVRDDGVWRAQALLMPTVDALCAYTEQELLTRPAEAFDLAWENRYGLMQGGDCEQS
jgi:tRNA-dihydrouridine synthase B